ncbi:MAG: hypothetical protein MR210_02970, partial [Erysipelotrichaceae bacterium]|nr:hypothetical protein [Erysipelotrichaceae bacterium]
KKVFERKELNRKSINRYFKTLEKKLEKSLQKYDEFIVSIVNNSYEAQAGSLNYYLLSIREIIRYYEQSKVLSKYFSKSADQLIILNIKLYDIECDLENNSSNVMCIGAIIMDMHEIIHLMHTKCVYLNEGII